MAKVEDDVLDALESLDGHAGLRNGLRAVARAQGHWAGIPMPLDGEQLIIEPRYPHAEGLMAIGAKSEPDDEAKSQSLPVVNVFYSIRYRCRVAVVEKDGKRYALPIVGTGNGATLALTTLGCQEAWGIEQEARAIRSLGEIVRHRQFKQYLLAGSFIERSRRSGVAYIFRRLRPTIALATGGKNLKILCTLCLHPIGFYQGSFAGAMCPTDDVVAHLQLMRADEPKFWAWSNQHPATAPESGL